jgi:hypothetical protein
MSLILLCISKGNKKAAPTGCSFFVALAWKQRPSAQGKLTGVPDCAAVALCAVVGKIAIGDRHRGRNCLIAPCLIGGCLIGEGAAIAILPGAMVNW